MSGVHRGAVQPQQILEWTLAERVQITPYVPAGEGQTATFGPERRSVTRGRLERSFQLVVILFRLPAVVGAYTSCAAETASSPR